MTFENPDKAKGKEPGYYFARFNDDNNENAWFIVSIDRDGYVWETGGDVAQDATALEFGRRIDIEKERHAAP